MEHTLKRTQPVSLPKISWRVVVLILIIALVGAAVSTKPKNQKRYVVMLDDDLEYSDVIRRIIAMDLTGVQVVPFVTCDALVSTIPVRKYEAYILDYNLGDGMLGTLCIPKIRSVDPQAFIIGNSMNRATENTFLEKGANAFCDASEGSGMLIQILKTSVFP